MMTAGQFSPIYVPMPRSLKPVQERPEPAPFDDSGRSIRHTAISTFPFVRVAGNGGDRVKAPVPLTVTCAPALTKLGHAPTAGAIVSSTFPSFSRSGR